MTGSQDFDTPFPRHRLRYLILKLLVIAGGVVLALVLAGVI